MTTDRRSLAASAARDLPRVLRLVVVLVALGVGANVTFTLLTTDRRAWEALASLTPGYLALAVLLALMPWLTESLRLLVWARFFGRPLQLVDTFRCVLAGQVGAALAPIAVGNAAAKTAMLVERGLTPGEAAAAESLSLVEDFGFFVVALPVAAVGSGAWALPVVVQARASVAARLTSPAVVAGLIAAFVAAAVIVVLLAQRRKRLLGLREVLRTVLRRGKRRLALTVLIGAVHWSCRYSVIAALAASLGVMENPLRLFFLQWFVFTAMTFVPLPGAAVGAESAFYLVYDGILPGWSIGILTAAWRFCTFYGLVILAAGLLVALPWAGRREAPAAEGPPPAG